MRTFVTTDTHGQCEQLKQVLQESGFRYQIDRLIHCGDIVDRGPDSFGVVEELLKIKKLVPVQGNHDWCHNEWIKTGQHQLLSYFKETRASYVKGIGEDSIYLNRRVPQSHKDLFNNQYMYYIDEQNRCFVHAGYDRHEFLTGQDEDFFLWDTSFWRGSLTCKGDNKYNDMNNFKRVFIGHQPTINWQEKDDEGKRRHIMTPMYSQNIVNVDTGSVFGGKLSLIDITDDENHILYQA